MSVLRSLESKLAGLVEGLEWGPPMTSARGHGPTVVDHPEGDP